VFASTVPETVTLVEMSPSTSSDALAEGLDQVPLPAIAGRDCDCELPPVIVITGAVVSSFLQEENDKAPAIIATEAIVKSCFFMSLMKFLSFDRVLCKSCAKVARYPLNPNFFDNYPKISTFAAG
jgi:hypothetical protein